MVGHQLIRSLISPRRAKLFLFLCVPLSTACSALQPTDAGGPRSNQPPYPIVISEDPDRMQRSLLIWQHLAQSIGISEKTEVRLHPYTATIESLPPNVPLYLPRIGTSPTMNEKETRESLRRFIKEWQGLIGANADQLSLIERTDEAGGSKLARYEQYPFRYPLRGDYGALRIRFGADRRVLELSSTCIPNADSLQPALATTNAQLSWDEAANRAVNLSVSFSTQGRSGTYQLSPSNQPQVQQLVIYARDPAPGSESPQLYLAWEIKVTNAPFQLIYLDAVKGEIISAL